MNIREQENTLFEKWRTKRGRTPFVIDGVPFPELYEKSKPRILFILKDCNLGDYGQEVFDLRAQMEHEPNMWWRTVANWGLLLQHISSKEPEWNEIINKQIQKGLKPYAFIQLKKKSGKGRISDAELWRYAEEDSNLITRQIQIYSPHMIVAAGTGRFVRYLLNITGELKRTPRGIGYWIYGKSADSVCYIIDFCHPSNRAGKKVMPAIGYGLLDACRFLHRERKRILKIHHEIE